MWNGLIVFLAVVFISTMIGAISNWLRKQQQAEIDRRAAQTRSGPPRTKPDGALEKFAEEVDRLRQKRMDDVARSRAPKGALGVATVTSKVPPKVIRRPLIADAPVVVPVVRSTSKPLTLAAIPSLPTIPTSPKLLPEALMVTSTETIHSPATIATIIAAQAPATIRRPKDVGGKDTSQAAPNLLALLANPQSLPLAVILAEILGPPQCKKR